MGNNTKNRELEERVKKQEELRANGINPYSQKVSITHKLGEIIEKFNEFEKDKTQITLAGRIKSKRSHGNLTFASLRDAKGNIQIALTKNDLGDEYKKFVKSADIGDFIEISGECFVTHKGENSVLVKKWKILTKAIRPLPEKWHGLNDDDKKQRFRELEMISDESALERFRKRFEATKVIRQFMWSNGFTEVETPILQNVYGGTYAKPFTTYYHGLDQDFYLRIAPEMFLKRTITGGFEKIFEIGKCFRNEGMDPSHLQEFTMFEFYWSYVDYNHLMDFTEKLIAEIIEKVYGEYIVKFGSNVIDFKPPYPRITFEKLIEENLKVKISDIDTEEKIEKYVKENSLEEVVNLNDKVGWVAKLDELYKKTVRKEMINPVFVTDYPKELMALAKTKEDDPSKVATFQLVINTWEMIKAYNELNDPIDQRERFEKQERLIEKGDEEAMPFDHDFVESMEYGMPPMAGWGMGLDRFFALLEGEENVRDMVMFPPMKRLEEVLAVQKNESVKIEELGIDSKKAHGLMDKYVKEDINKFHLLETEAIMKALAKYFDEDEEAWGVIGLLHDIDWEMTKADVKNHTIKAVDILKSEGGTDKLIESVVSHCYGNQECGEHPDKERSTRLEHTLAASETITGLIVANALMQPDKKVSSVKLTSLKKKFKQKSFAANCNRDIIREIENTGIELDEFFEISLEAIKGIAKEINL